MPKVNSAPLVLARDVENMSREVMTTLQFLSSAVVSRLLQTLSHLRRGADGDGNPRRFGKTKED